MSARQWLVEHLPTRGNIKADRQKMQALASYYRRYVEMVDDLRQREPEIYAQYAQWADWQGYDPHEAEAFRLWRELHGYFSSLDYGFGS
jgi:hypothetical protein